MKNCILVPLFLSLLALCACHSQYRVSAFINASSTYTIQLSYFGTEDYYMKPTSPIVKELTLTFHAHAFNDFTLKIYDSKNQRFEVPQEGVFPTDPLKNFSFPISLAAVRF